MILKDREYPLKAQILEAVLRRLPTGHPQKERIENELTPAQLKLVEEYMGFEENYKNPDNFIINDI